MRRVRTLLSRRAGSRVGRRLLLLFLAAAFVPVTAMVIVSFVRVTATLEESLEAELAGAAKREGMHLFDLLTRYDELLGDAAGPMSAGQPLPQATARRLGRAFSAVALLDASEPIAVDPAGMPVSRPTAAGSRPGRGPLAPRVRIEPGTPPRIVIEHAFADDAGRLRRVAGTIDPGSFWTGEDSLPPMTDICVATSAAMLHCSRPAGGLPIESLPVGSGEGSAGLRWEQDGETLRARTWTLFLQSRFAAGDWHIVAIQPEDHALRATHAFQGSFILSALLALLAVAWAGTSQIRRILVPLRRLLGGTQRVAAQDFDARIDVDGDDDDEFGQLAGAFNTMTQRLGRHFRTLAALADIDRRILASGDLQGVAETAARCIQELAQADVVSVALREPANGRWRLAATCVKGQPVAAGVEFAWRAAPTPRSGPTPWEPASELPLPCLDALRGAGADFVARVPVVQGEQIVGAVLLGTAAPRAPFDNDAIRFGGVVDRLAVAVAAAARDRQLMHQAHFDALTGLPNRYHLVSLLDDRLARARAHGGMVAVLFIDLDHFKQTNDTLGHGAGDRLLQGAALRIQAAVRTDDVVARFGGDEFVVVFDDVDGTETAARRAQALVDDLSRPFEVGVHGLYLGASVGIAMYPADAETGEDLLKQADTAMYRAKAAGRRGYAFFEAPMLAAAKERARIERELRQALTRRELVLHFQPQRDLRSGRVVAAEALVRWQHPERGLLGPGTFIGVAEECGLIDAIGSWVLESACEQLATWRGAGHDLACISVNVSIRQLQQPDFAQRVPRVLARHGLAPAALELEVTESLFADSVCVERLRTLHADGVSIAVDDFGTGYSSFAYLRTLPISVLKIDRSFLCDVEHSGEAATVARAIVNMAHALGKIVVAEGVETQAQVDFLAGTTCERLQGYVFSRPLPVDTFDAFLRGQARESGGRVESEPAPASAAA
jgi:diguanylate cyclase (GGDEF)-like protein